MKVRPGETLKSFAERALEDPAAWPGVLGPNPLLSGDPDRPLPGMTLSVPTELLKMGYRTARLVLAEREVLSRARDAPDWVKARPGALLHEGDGVRTLARSRARVEFSRGARLDLEPDSMVILRSAGAGDGDLVLNRGGLRTTSARVITPSARITPRTRATRYSARVLDDLSTKVEVFQGSALVQDSRGAKAVEVREGYSVRVAAGQPPAPPILTFGGKLPAATVSKPGPEASAASPPAKTPGPTPDDYVSAAMAEVPVGQAVASCELQISTEPGFGRVMRSGVEADSELHPLRTALEAGLPPGRYWWRYVPVDLLGVRGKPSQPVAFELRPEAPEAASPETPALCR